MTRQQHLDWCKARALEYVEAGDLRNALASMLSDLNKHPDLEKHAGIQLGFALLFNGYLSTVHEMREFINGFN